MDWPASVGSKLDRAYEHLALLPVETGRYFESHPYRAPLDEHYEEARFVLRVVLPVPLRVSILIGDVVHNARSALDHLANALILAHDALPTTKTGFPIFDLEGKFNAKEKAFPEGKGFSMLPGVPDMALAIACDVQPYHMGQDAERHPLWVLYKLSNSDKHRQLSLVAGAAQGAYIHLVEPNDGPIAMYGDMTAGVIYDGDEMARFPTTRDDILSRQLDKKVQLTGFVSLDERPVWRGEPLEEALLRVLGFIGESIIPRFRPFFT